MNEIFFIGDTHFGHSNIIRYCHRPFANIKQMNQMLIDNWNREVDKDDLVYFLGDFSYRRARWEYLNQLNGRIIFIKGNHDNNGAIFEIKFRYKGYNFVLVHDPVGVYHNGNWVIHGHIHNNDIANCPFINYDKRTINVSCEMIGYKPINIKEIIRCLN